MREIFIDKREDNTKLILLVEDGILIEKYQEKESYKRLEGNIYLGKVRNILQGMQAAFVDIGKSKNSFIHANDIIPKVDVTREETKLANIKDVAKTGMPLMVQVKRDRTQKKGARVSTHISIPGRYVVLMPNVSIITISQKIEEKEERNRLLEIIKNNLPEKHRCNYKNISSRKE